MQNLFSVPMTVSNIKAFHITRTVVKTKKKIRHKMTLDVKSKLKAGSKFNSQRKNQVNRSVKRIFLLMGSDRDINMKLKHGGLTSLDQRWPAT